MNDRIEAQGVNDTSGAKAYEDREDVEVDMVEAAGLPSEESVTPVGGPGSGMRHPPFTSETAREAGRKGGKASGEARRMRGEMREVTQVILASEIRDDELVKAMHAAGFRFGCGKKVRYPTVAEAMLFRQVAIAIDPTKGNEADSRTSFKLIVDAASGRIGRPIEEEEAAIAAAKTAGTGKDEEPVVGFESF